MSTVELDVVLANLVMLKQKGCEDLLLELRLMNWVCKKVRGQIIIKWESSFDR